MCIYVINKEMNTELIDPASIVEGCNYCYEEMKFTTHLGYICKCNGWKDAHKEEIEAHKKKLNESFKKRTALKKNSKDTAKEIMNSRLGEMIRAAVNGVANGKEHSTIVIRL